MSIREVGKIRFPRGRRGFSLIEMLTVIWALSLVLLLGVTTLLGAFKIERAAGAAFHQQTQRNFLADQFRADVAEATEAPDRLDQIKAGPTCLILRMAESRYTLYRWEEDRLERAESVEPGKPLSWMSQGGAYAAVEFSRSGTDRRLLTMTLSVLAGSGPRQRSIPVAATLGGDLR